MQRQLVAGNAIAQFGGKLHPALVQRDGSAAALGGETLAPDAGGGVLVATRGLAQVGVVGLAAFGVGRKRVAVQAHIVAAQDVGGVLGTLGGHIGRHRAAAGRVTLAKLLGQAAQFGRPERRLQAGPVTVFCRPVDRRRGSAPPCPGRHRDGLAGVLRDERHLRQIAHQFGREAAHGPLNLDLDRLEQVGKRQLVGRGLQPLDQLGGVERTLRGLQRCQRILARTGGEGDQATRRRLDLVETHQALLGRTGIKRPAGIDHGNRQAGVAARQPLHQITLQGQTARHQLVGGRIGRHAGSHQQVLGIELQAVSAEVKKQHRIGRRGQGTGDKVVHRLPGLRRAGIGHLGHLKTDPAQRLLQQARIGQDRRQIEVTRVIAVANHQRQAARIDRRQGFSVCCHHG